MKASKKERAILQAISYLHDEGFLEVFLLKGEPCVRLTKELHETRRKIKEFVTKRESWEE